MLNECIGLEFSLDMEFSPKPPAVGNAQAIPRGARGCLDGTPVSH